MDVFYSQLGEMSVKERRGKCLSKHIGKLRRGKNVEGKNGARETVVTNQVAIELYMFCPLVKDEVRGKMNGGLIVTVEEGRMSVCHLERSKNKP